MRGREAYRLWAPELSPWSLWAKPTLFAQESLAAGSRAFAPDMPPSPQPQAIELVSGPVVTGIDPTGKPILSQPVPPQPEPTNPLTEEMLRNAPKPDGSTLLIAELRGYQSAQAAVLLAKRGWRPVPLFNGTWDTNAEVQMRELVTQLMLATDALQGIAIPENAPPVFLLDSGRKGQRTSPPPGTFDNRWMVLPQDFPSGNLLRSRGFKTAIVLGNGTTLEEDLRHVLCRWQEAEIKIQVDDLNTTAGPADYTLTEPSGFRSVFYNVLAMFGFYRNSAGGFGGRVPVPSQGGGYG
jgi:hypothetical protein